MRQRKDMWCSLRKFLDKRAVMAGLCLASGVILMQAQPCFAKKETKETLEQLESAVASAATSRIQYQSGKVRTASGWYWRKSKKISLTAVKLKVRKKGKYTFRIIKKNGKSKLFTLKLDKKTYPVTVNTAKKQKTGYYMLGLKGDTSRALGIKDSVLKKGASAFMQPRGSTAAEVWVLESAGGKGFRLKNENSGLYLTAKSSRKKGTVFAQRKYSDSNRGQIYQCYPVDSNYFYIKNLLTKEYLYVAGDSLKSGIRDNKKQWKFKITSLPRPVPRVTVTGETYPVSLYYGRAFSIKGMVTSYYTIKKLTARVLDSRGTACIQKTVKPASNRYDLTGVDAALTFGKLAVGTYRYQVLAGDSGGNVRTVLDREFVVYVPGGTGAKTLIYNSAAIAGVGHQSAGDEKEKKACASYALAYCNAILTGRAVSPHTYWMSSTNVDCVWSKGGYTTHAYASEQDVLQTAYGQLAAGKPCILHVTGKTGNQHWVTLVGYKNVIKTSALKASNFIALDPWSGKVITVSDSYQVRTTYRLAYRS